MPAIKIDTNAPVRLSNVHFANWDVAIQSNAGASVEADNLSFDNVRVPFDLAGNAESRVQGTRIINDPKAKEQSRGKAFSGWRRPHGPPLPAFCPNCKTVFPSRNYNFGSSRFYSRDNEETCSECRFEHAKLSDGLFDLAGNAVRALDAPDITHAMLAAINRIASAAVSEKLTPEQTIKDIEKVKPPIANYLRTALTLFGPTGMAYVAAALSVAAIVYAHVQTGATLESLDLDREQTQIAREALTLQKEQSSPDKVLERIVDELADIKFILEAPRQAERQEAAQEPSNAPADSEPPPETSSGDD